MPVGEFGRLIIFAIGVTGIVVLTTRYRWHAFVAIFFATIAIGLASGVEPQTVVTQMVDGFGKMLGYTGIIVVSGIIIGEFLDKTGAALTISQAVLRVVGRARAALAMAISGYILAVPVMCSDTSFIILSPIARAVAARARLSVPVLSLALAAGAYTSFKLIPPSPGPLAVLTMFNADFARTLALSAMVSVPVFLVGLLWAVRQPVTSTAVAIAEPADPESGGRQPPGIIQAFLPLAAPILLIVARAAAARTLMPVHPVRAFLDFAGHPAVALPAGVGLLMLLNRWAGMESMRQWTGDAIARSAAILVIVGAGGALSSVLQQTGMGEVIGTLLTTARVPGVLVPFLLALLLKTTQGSSLVTMFTTPAIVAPILPALGLSPEIAALSVFAGALAVVHVNDSFFWVVTRFAGLSVAEGYRSLTMLTLLQGVTALAAVWGLSAVL